MTQPRATLISLDTNPCMHLLIPVFFNAPQGGLHENVRATALFMLSRKYQVTLVCRPGPFAEQMREQGAEVIETDYAELSFATALAEIRALHQRQPYRSDSHPPLCRATAGGDRRPGTGIAVRGHHAW